MALYIDRDIETDDAGEIQLENGDLKIASVKRTMIQAINWLVLTNRGESFWGDAVANLGSFFGKLNIARTHRAMEANIRRAVDFQRAMYPTDVRPRVVPTDINEAVVIVTMNGNFILLEGEEAEDGDQRLAYQYPFGTGLPVKVDLPAS